MKVIKINPAWIDQLALCSIGILSLGYALFQATVAEMHVQFSFLNFPVFVGEFVLMFCSALFLYKLCVYPVTINRWHVVVSAYFAFVLIKAFYGYSKWGPLAFRDAAMMYYPIFSVFGYYFFQNRYFTEPVKLLFIVIITAIFISNQYSVYMTLTFFVLALVLIKTLRNRPLRWAALCCVLIFARYQYFFQTARMMILAHLVFIIYIIGAGCASLRWSNKIKFFAAVIIMAVMGTVTVKVAGLNRVKSIFEFNRFKKIYLDYDREIQIKRKNFKFEDRPNVQIYHPDKKIKAELANVETASNAYIEVADPYNMDNYTEADIYHQDLNNSVFRLFIWRDLFEEYSKHWPVLGFDYGKPFRSISLEIMRWAESEWKRDGWVAPHNSFFHIIYRSGMIGVIFITGILALLARMIGGFINIRSLTGILLCGILLSWVVAVNFLLILELPYTAIPIWSLYGMTFAYYQSKIKPEKAAYGLEK